MQWAPSQLAHHWHLFDSCARVEQQCTCCQWPLPVKPSHSTWQAEWASFATVTRSSKLAQVDRVGRISTNTDGHKRNNHKSERTALAALVYMPVYSHLHYPLHRCPYSSTAIARCGIDVRLEELHRHRFCNQNTHTFGVGASSYDKCVFNLHHTFFRTYSTVDAAWTFLE